MFLSSEIHGTLLHEQNVYNVDVIFISECPKYCSLCYNETECYECSQGYFLNELQQCESRFSIFNFKGVKYVTNIY